MDKRNANSIEYKNTILQQLDKAIENKLSFEHPKDKNRNIIVLNSLPNLAFKKMETLSVPLVRNHAAQTRTIDFPFISFYRKSIKYDKIRFSNLYQRKTNYSIDYNVTELKKMNIPVIIQYEINLWCEDLYEQNYLVLKTMGKLSHGSLGPFKIEENRKKVYFPFYCLNEQMIDNSDIEINEMMEIFRNTFIVDVYASLPSDVNQWDKTVRKIETTFEMNK